MNLHVEVTAEDIAAGKPYDLTDCPIAIAIARTGHYAIVGDTDVDVAVAGNFVTDIPLPYSARSFIRRFDRGEKVDPFSFGIHVGRGATQ